MTQSVENSTSETSVSAAAGAASHTVVGKSAAPLSERCRILPTNSDQATQLIQEWSALYDDPQYAKYFLTLLNTLRRESVVSQLIVHYHRQHRPRGLFRRGYDSMSYAETKSFIESILSDLPSQPLPLPHQMAQAYRAFEFFMNNFRYHPLIPELYYSRKWYRGNEVQALEWLGRLYNEHLRTNFTS